MNTKQLRLVSFGCLIALSANTLTSFAQGAAQPKQTPGARVWVTRPDGTGQAEGQTFEFFIADGQERQISAPPGSFEVVTTGAGGTMAFYAGEMSFDTQVVKGVPFSAIAVNETTQTLSDGNRIVRRTSSSIYRDSEGRTRREQALGSVGPYTTVEKSPQRVFINDAVAGVNYILDPHAQTAQKNSSAQIRMMSTSTVVASSASPSAAAAGGLKLTGAALQGAVLRKIQPEYPPVAKAAVAQGSVQVEITVGENGQVMSAEVVSGHPLLRQSAIDAARQWQFKPTELSGKPVKVEGLISFNYVLDKSANTSPPEKTATAVPSSFSFERVPFAGGEKVELRKEALGKQKIDGVEADGTRSVSTIPAGSIGNERAIEIVSERWFSAELQTVVLTRHSDPRTGESVYRLENINRAEPPANLFQVPADYSVNEPAQMMRRKAEQQ